MVILTLNNALNKVTMLHELIKTLDQMLRYMLPQHQHPLKHMVFINIKKEHPIRFLFELNLIK